MKRTVRRVIAGVVAAALFGACGSGEPSAEEPGTTTSTTATPTPSPPTSTSAPAPSPTKAAEPEPETPTLEVTVTGDDVSPNAEEITLEAGEELTIVIVSDRTGELHAHSRPEAYLQFGPGRTEVTVGTEAPGVFEIEEHDTGVVVALVEARG